MHIRKPKLSASRRDVMKSAAGLVIGFTFAGAMPRVAAAAAAPVGPGVLAPDAFVRVAPDNTVTVIIKHLEMGQGVTTGLSTIVAEELDADWAQVRFEAAPADQTLYANTLMGIQLTGGSTAVANSYAQLRKAGATARAMLVDAAAQAWRVPAGEITVAKGVVSHATSNNSATFGQLAERASGLPAPADVPLKDPANYTLIGTRIPRLDSFAKTNGTAQFTIDLKMPGMATAVVARPPRFGATAKTVDDAAAKRIPGVQYVAIIPSGVAVVADSFWNAVRGRDALAIEWDETNAEKRGTAEILAEYRALAKDHGAPARSEGDAPAAFMTAAKTVSSEFVFPYLAHAPMEPMDCVVRLTDGACEIWTGCQFHTVDQQNAAAAAGLTPQQVEIHTLYSGGSFGRRANSGSDFIVEAVNVAKAVPAGRPVKLMWTREDDIRGGLYRPMYLHTLSAGLDAQGNVTVWGHRIVGQSIMAGTVFESMMVRDGVDGTSVEGASTLPYAFPNIVVDLHSPKVGVPVLWWRSVGSTHTAYSTEVFMDEIARATGQDPVAFRRKHLTQHPRHLAALNLAAEKAGWGGAMPAGKARGVAVHESFGTVVAQVAEVSLADDGAIKVDRVVCAVDCGVAINPDVIAAQMEGAIGFGLGAVMKGAITLEGGQVQQANFDGYEVLRMDEMPHVEVHIVPSANPPTGVGEPGVPPIGPAVANAIAVLKGEPPRVLPIGKSMGA